MHNSMSLSYSRHDLIPRTFCESNVSYRHYYLETPRREGNDIVWLREQNDAPTVVPAE